MAKKTKKSKKRFSPRVLLAIALLLFVTAVAVKHVVPQHLRKEVPPDPTVTHPVIVDIYRNMDVRQVNNVSELKDTGFWWKSNDGYNIWLTGEGILYGVKVPKNANLEVRKEFILSQPGMRRFYDLSLDTMIQQGFTRNPNPLSFVGSDVEAYENAGSKCVVQTWLSAQTPAENAPEEYQIVTSCSDDFDLAYNEQISLLKGLGLHNDGIHYMTKSGDYYKLGISGPGYGGGHYMIVKKDGANFIKIIPAAQDDAPCSFLKEHQVPEEVYGSCWEDTPEMRATFENSLSE